MTLLAIIERDKVRAIAFGTVAFALRAEPCFASRRCALQSTIAGAN